MYFLLFYPFCALLLDKLFGELPTRFHPICFAGNWAIQVEKLLRKGENGKKMFWRGVLAWLLVLFPCLFVVILTTALPLLSVSIFVSSKQELQNIASIFSFCIALFWTWICIAPRSLAEHAQRVAQALEENNLPKAQQELSMIVGRNTSILDAFAVARACIESVAENLTDGVLATLFWVMFALVFSCMINSFFSNPLENYFDNFLLYSPLLIVNFITLHRVTNILDAMWGKKNEKYVNFGTMSAITDDVLNYIPARLGLFCVAFACLFVKFCNALVSLKIALKYKNAHESPNSAWTESAFAGALNLKFGGPAHYVGISVDHPYIGEGSLEAKASHIYLAIQLMWASSIVFACLMSFLLYIGCVSKLTV